jgi:hypothetical protein
VSFARVPRSGSSLVSAARWALVAVSLFVARDAPARVLRIAGHAGGYVEPLIAAPSTVARVATWARDLPPIEVIGGTTHAGAHVRLYGDDGEMDPAARGVLERVAANDAEPHPLAPRVEQLLVRAAYHFGAASVLVVSAWRENASRHGTGEAIDFKLEGVRARELAAYLRGLPRAGVGIYTHPRTQFVHLDVRDQSYHWIDASPPGVKWREAQLRDPGAAKRDATWTPDNDLPR